MSRVPPLVALFSGLLVLASSGALALQHEPFSVGTLQGLVVAFVAASVAFALAFGVASAATKPLRDPLRLSVRTGKICVGVLIGVAVFTQFAAAGPAVAALVGGWLQGRGSRHGSDAVMFGTFVSVAVGVLLAPSVWDDPPRVFLPVLLVSLALIAREAWDLAEAARRAAPHIPAQGPDPRREAMREWSGAVALLALAAVTAGGSALLRARVRAGLQEAFPPHLRILLVIAGLAALAGVGFLLRAAPREPPTARQPADAAGPAWWPRT